jgi:tetratricopeptide (TPR) repeat protein
MKLNNFVRIGALSLAAVLSTDAQAQQPQAQQPPAQQSQAQQPKPKSQKEVDALQKVQAAEQAQNWDGVIASVNAVLENFADTEYKGMLLNMAMDAAQRKGDQVQTSVYADRVIEAEPNNIPARVTLAASTVQHVRETDLDKETTLKKVDEYANKALELLKAANTPPTGMTDAQWPEFKKQLTSQAYDSLGQAAGLRKNYPEEIKNFKTALEEQPTNSVAMARLSKAYVNAKQYDDAIATADKVLAMADAPASVKTFAQQSKDNATKLKGAPAAK